MVDSRRGKSEPGIPGTTDSRRSFMNRNVIAAAVALALSLSLAGNTLAAEVKVVATVNTIAIAPSGDNATVILKDGSGKTLQVLVTDEVTLDKLKDKRISDGDEVRVKYDTDKGNTTTLFRKTAGC
jgi:uncharacterized membrane protein